MAELTPPLAGSFEEGFLMLGLTQQERQTILFLITIALIGLAINFFLKTNSRIAQVIRLDERLVKLDINEAGLEDLVGTQLITPKLAKKIIEYRTESGPFRGLEDLKNIKGIGDYRYEKLKELFYVK